jgi:hypothetical protein
LPCRVAPLFGGDRAPGPRRIRGKVAGAHLSNTNHTNPSPTRHPFYVSWLNLKLGRGGCPQPPGLKICCGPFGTMALPDCKSSLGRGGCPQPPVLNTRCGPFGTMALPDWKSSLGRGGCPQPPGLKIRCGPFGTMALPDCKSSLGRGGCPQPPVITISTDKYKRPLLR